MKRSLALLALLALPLTGCASTDAPEQPATTAAATKSSKAAADEGKDVTKQLKAAAGARAKHIDVATETEPGRIVVETSLVDPRGDAGSPAAKDAIAICEATVKLKGTEHVSVMEADGTTWILFGHPMATEGECTEV